MSELFLIIVLLIGYIAIQSILHHRQISQLQKLIKSESLREFNDYTQPGSSARRYIGMPHGANQVMDQPNEISVDDPEFDLSKVTEVSIDGEERPISIL